MKFFVGIIVLVAVCSVTAQADITSQANSAAQSIVDSLNNLAKVPLLGAILSSVIQTVFTIMGIVVTAVTGLLTTGSIGAVSANYPSVLTSAIVGVADLPIVSPLSAPFIVGATFIVADVINLLAGILEPVLSISGSSGSVFASLNNSLGSAN